MALMKTTTEPRPRPKPSATGEGPAAPDAEPVSGNAEAVVGPDGGAVVELVTDVEVVAGILPKMDETMAEIFVSAADCTPLQRPRSEAPYVCFFNADHCFLVGFL
ncbi:hypothetical protein INS49_007341 [Diaporthe citri]|uniref:uncharacterized protein n=1 Tax=Diaporthe citri TaxID=83186 RepID=UPI001C7F6EDC|nr:uncharacterized protein INS49_007341 [Diaporthe citri]KAG6365730.1 hypothetical protein INS49_007341 [Diaporthe citri]